MYNVKVFNGVFFFCSFICQLVKATSEKKVLQHRGENGPTQPPLPQLLRQLEKADHETWLYEVENSPARCRGSAE